MPLSSIHKKLIPELLGIFTSNPSSGMVLPKGERHTCRTGPALQSSSAGWLWHQGRSHRKLV